MLKKEVRALVRNTLPRYDKSGRFNDRYIDGAITKAIAQILNDIWRINPLNLLKYTVRYGYSTSITINSDSTTGVKYATLPESIIPFQDKASGVRRVSTITQGAAVFFPMDQREMDLVSNGSYVDTITSMVGYSVSQDRIEFYNLPLALQSVGCRMDLIIPFSKYAETDEVKIPEIEDAKTGQTFVDRVMKILGIAPRVDLKDDNSSAIINTKDN